MPLAFNWTNRAEVRVRLFSSDFALSGCGAGEAVAETFR